MSVEHTEDRADLTAWLAVIAGNIGALMASLDTSIVNTSLPTIQGAIGASGSEGTWMSTAYLVAEIVMIPLSGWLETIFGLRNFLALATSLFTVFSLWCGTSQDLVHMIIGRVGQGFTGGALVPTALSIVATRLPPRQQPVGVAAFGMTAVLGPLFGPIIGGWLTENISWHYAFFLNLPVCAGLLVLLFIGLPPQKVRWGDFADTDVFGLLGLPLGLGGLTVVLEEGQRNRWFESAMIRDLSIVSLVGFALLIIGQVVSRRPVIQLKILGQRAFAAVFILSIMIGAALYAILYLIPQFLAAVPGYNSEQAGYITVISGIPTMLLLPVFPRLVRLVDVRLAIAFGLLLYGISCFMNAPITPDWVGGEFFWPQVIRGVAQFFAFIFLNQAATSSVTADYAGDASGLFNAARNLGGSFGLAVISTMQDRRMTLHVDRLSESITANSVLGQEYVQQHGIMQLYQAIQNQATIMTYGDLYWIFGVALVGIIPFVLLLRPLPKDSPIGIAG